MSRHPNIRIYRDNKRGLLPMLLSESLNKRVDEVFPRMNPMYALTCGYFDDECDDEYFIHGGIPSDDDYDDDEMELVYPKKPIGLVPMGEGTDKDFKKVNGVRSIPDEHTIFFYNDYHNKYDLCEFNAVNEFIEFCKDEGIVIPKRVYELLKNSSICHCCIDPTIRASLGQLVLICEESYGGMFYEACTAEELD